MAPPRYPGAGVPAGHAVAAYLREGATALGYGIMVLTIEQDKIGEITGFADPTLFPVFDLATRTNW